MQIRKIHHTAGRPLTPATPRRSRRLVLLGAGTLALVLTTSGIVAALAGRSSSVAKAHAPSLAVASPGPKAAPSLIRKSTPDRPVLADGDYPTYLRGVDVGSATITVDVLQVFEGDAAVKAAIEDGRPASEAQYLYVYIRNQNSRLRTLPVARDVRIEFIGECDAPPDRHAALTELARETTPFSETYYYEVTVTDGVIHRVTQHLAIPAC
jgi:hypothetical protein